MTETVAGQAEAAQLNTTDASLGNAVGTQAIVELPFEARNSGQSAGFAGRCHILLKILLRHALKKEWLGEWSSDQTTSR